MIVRKTASVPSKDVGMMLGKPAMGIRIQWLIHSGIGDDAYQHNFAVRRFTFDPGKSFPLHHHKYVEGVYILSGKGYFATDKEEVEVVPGDVVYTATDEPHALGALGEEPLVFLCCIDCVREKGGDSCSPDSKVVCMVLDEQEGQEE